jgi:hypothetical protein
MVPELVDLGEDHKVACLLRYPEVVKLEMGIPVDATSRESTADSNTGE